MHCWRRLHSCGEEKKSLDNIFESFLNLLNPPLLPLLLLRWTNEEEKKFLSGAEDHGEGVRRQYVLPFALLPLPPHHSLLPPLRERVRSGFSAVAKVEDSSPLDTQSSKRRRALIVKL